MPRKTPSEYKINKGFYKRNIPRAPYKGEELEEEKFLKRLINNIESHIQYLTDYQNTIEDVMESKSVEYWAAMEALNKTAQNADDILIGQYKIAAEMSGEYNYSLYADHAEEALLSNYIYLTNVRFREPENPTLGIEVIVDFSRLGNTEEWLKIAQQVREAGPFGLHDDIDFRSRIWKEKIYGAGREGTKIEKGASDGSDEAGEDVTANYIDLYEKTIAARLVLAGPNKMPWWELLNYGNISFGEGDDGGEPYPIFGPTDFIQKTEAIIENLWNDYYQAFLNNSREFFIRKVAEDFDLTVSEKFVKSFGGLDDAAFTKIAKELLEKGADAPGNKVFGYIGSDEKELGVYKRGDKLVRVYPVWKHRR